MRDRIIGKIKMFIKRDVLFSAEVAAISIADIYAIILSGVIDAPVIISGMFLLCIATVCWYYVGHQQASPKEKARCCNSQNSYYTNMLCSYDSDAPHFAAY